MKSLKVILAVVIMSLGVSHLLGAQELNCSVEINTDKISGTDKNVFTTLQTAIAEYMNNNQWGNAQFMVNEKIDCKLFFAMSSIDGTKMSGTLQVQSTRPVYNSSYTTTLINFKDNSIEFDYQENEPLVFSDNNMESNLTAILNFYAYLILAVDFDSFSPNGGDYYYEKAANVVAMAQSSGEKAGKHLRIIKPKCRVERIHRQFNKSNSDIAVRLSQEGVGRDGAESGKGKSVITKSLGILKQIHDVSPMSVALSMFKDAKLDELVNVYSKSNQTEKQSVYELLYPLYPTERERLDKIKEETKN